MHGVAVAMRVTPTFVLLPILAATAASAAPFQETLAPKQRDAIVAAIRAAIPPADAAATARCQPSLDAYNQAPIANLDKTLEAAPCMHAAGNFGVAIVLWRTYVTYGSDRAKKHDALVSLAAAYEHVGGFREAAMYAEQYAADFAAEADARARLTRAMCIRRQLGDVDEAHRDAKQLRASHEIDTAPEELCASIRPIAMP